MAVEAGLRPLFGTPDSGGRFLWALRRFLGGALLLLIVTVAVSGAATHLAPLMGWEAFTLRGGSMEPDIPLGSIVAVSPVDKPQVGDVITYRAANGVAVTHRVVGHVAVDGVPHLLTQGDANEDPDPAPVALDSVVGRVEFHVPAIGYLSWMLSTASGLIGIVSAFLALLTCLWLVEEVDNQRMERARLRQGRL